MTQAETRSYHKKRLKGFWSKRWIPGRRIELWIVYLQNKGSSSHIIIQDALLKLTLEKKITELERQNLVKMLSSEDKENAVVALSVIEQLQPRAFKRKLKIKTI